ncbi:NADPH-dependent FMN reductase [Leptospira wolffii]|uniref:NADPH-dependent FMN reductase n=1 Tax=Leptospira wolffii TaxID=409998 RepID=A0ABV5BM81_9LEPT|nr:NAD(P)H-dependent oxidoreductase [Leptospira wolffii]TGL50848.1 NADPH-dependent oxidoreductase [Leptospira wolffii]
MRLESEPINPKLRLGVILGSTREGRFGETVSRWFVEQADRDDRFEVDHIDLKDFSLPWDMSRSVNSDLFALSRRVDRADAFVVVTPEYNHGYPAYLKLAIDCLREEWNGKPVGFVSYGGSSGGLRSVEQLRLVFTELRMTTIRDSVSFHWAKARFHNGRPTEEYRYNSAAERLLSELAWWGLALKTARNGLVVGTL